MESHSFVYLLHFSQPYHHAQHYLGCTRNLRERLRAHSRGDTARLLGVLHDCDLPWQVSALWVVPHHSAFQCELWLKHQKHSPRYCPLCNEHPSIVPWPSYPVEYLDIPITSTELASLKE